MTTFFKISTPKFARIIFIPTSKCVPKDLSISQKYEGAINVKILKLSFRIFEQKQFPKIQILSWLSDTGLVHGSFF